MKAVRFNEDFRSLESALGKYAMDVCEMLHFFFFCWLVIPKREAVCIELYGCQSRVCGGAAAIVLQIWVQSQVTMWEEQRVSQGVDVFALLRYTVRCVGRIVGPHRDVTVCRQAAAGSVETKS